MNQPEPESLPVDISIDHEIIKPAYPNAKSLVRLFFVLLFYSLIAGIILVVLLSIARGLQWKSPLLKPFFNLLGYIISLLFTIRYAIKKSKNRAQGAFSIRLNKFPVSLLPVIVVASLASIVGLERIADIIPMPSSVQKFFEDLLSKDPISVIQVVIAAPIMEELLCRGVVLGGLLKNYPPYKAILISALFFALIHLNPWQALPAFFGGLFMGWVFYKTKSVIATIIIHAVNNGTAMAFVFLPKNKQSFLSLLGTPYYIVLCACAVLLFIGGCWLINNSNHVSEDC